MMGGNVANVVKSKDEEGFAFCRFQKHEPSKDFAVCILSHILSISSYSLSALHTHQRYEVFRFWSQGHTSELGFLMISRKCPFEHQNTDTILKTFPLAAHTPGLMII